MARTSRSRSRTSPMKKRSDSSLKRAIISDCLSSSRLKMHSRRGRWRASMISTNLWPNDPVPPVTRTDASPQLTGPSVVTAMVSPGSLLPDRPEHGQEMEVELPGQRVEIARVAKGHLEARPQGVGLDEVLPGSPERLSQRVEIRRARQVASGAPAEDPPEPGADRHPRARLLEVGPGRRAVDVADEGVEVAGGLGERLGVDVR